MTPVLPGVADDTAFVSQRGAKVAQPGIALKLKDQILEYLHQQGFEVTEEAELIGKSGVEQTFDILAWRDDGFTSYKMAVCVTAGGNRDTEVTTIFNFANKAYDTGISDRVLIAAPEVSPEARQLANKQRIKVIDGKSMETLLASEPPASLKAAEPIKFETQEQLVASLQSRGYRVEELAKVQSRSGVEYSFDILAYVDMVAAAHSLGIDFLSNDNEVSLDQISLFDTKAYEVGIDDKIVVVSPTLSHEARQFAQHQHIRVFELGVKPVKPSAAKQPPSKSAAGKAEADAPKSHSSPVTR
jgi:general secretion pathway protein E